MSVIPNTIIDRYDVILFEEGAAINREPDPGTSVHHLRWMLNELRGDMEDGKSNRWLGFIQGVMVMKKLITVPEERDFTRSFFQKKED